MDDLQTRIQFPVAHSDLDGLMPDAQFMDPRLAALYDADSGWSVDRDYYLEQAGSEPIRVLDLGCGTGLLCAAFAKRNHEVTGVDPAAAMLDVARQRDGGDTVTWVCSDAGSFRSDARFDLIVMTGHAFQVLWDDADILTALQTMKLHLAEGGRVVFETRNPEFDWASLWNSKKTIVLPDGKEIPKETRNSRVVKGGIEFEHVYRFPDDTLTSKSRLRFATRHEVEAHLTASALVASAVFGDWQEGAFDPVLSREIIFQVRHA